MHNKTNDERLKILQDRLAQLKDKENNPIPPTINKTSTQEDAYNQQPENSVKSEGPKWGLEDKKTKSWKWLTYLIIFGIIAFITTQQVWNWDFSDMTTNKSSSLETKLVVDTDFVLEYKLNMPGNNIAITASLADESSAKALVNDLIIKGFKSNYFFLPHNSNSKEEIYKVFIGPYENLEETNQWCKNIKGEVNIVNL